MPNFRTTNQTRVIEFVRALVAAGFRHDKEARNKRNLQCNSFRTGVHRYNALLGRIRKVYYVSFSDQQKAHLLRPRKKSRKRECTDCGLVRLHFCKERCAKCYERYRYWHDPKYREQKIRSARKTYERRKGERHADQAMQ